MFVVLRDACFSHHHLHLNVIMYFNILVWHLPAGLLHHAGAAPFFDPAQVIRFQDLLKAGVDEEGARKDTSMRSSDFSWTPNTAMVWGTQESLYPFDCLCVPKPRVPTSLRIDGFEVFPNIILDVNVSRVHVSFMFRNAYLRSDFVQNKLVRALTPLIKILCQSAGSAMNNILWQSFSFTHGHRKTHFNIQHRCKHHFL